MGWSLSIALSMISFVVYLLFCRLDFDQHHDGLLMTGAVASRDGLRVHSQYYAQYGPVLPWLQGIAASLTDNVAVAIRVLNAALLALTVYSLAEFGRLRPQSVPISRSAGLCAALIWVTTSDVFGWVPMFPWSSSISLCLTTWVVLALIRAVYYHDKGKVPRSKLWVTIAALCVALLPFTRINVGVSALLIAVVLSVVVIAVSSEYRNIARFFLSSLTLSIGLILGYLAICGSLKSWWHQSIIEPWSSQTEMKRIYDPLAVYEKLNRSMAVGMIIIMSGYFCGWVLWKRNRFSVVIKYVSTVVLTLSLNIYLYCYLFLQGNKVLAISGAITKNNPYNILNQKSFNFLVYLAWLSLFTAVVIAVFVTIFVMLRKIILDEAFWWILLAGFTVSGLTQIWPIPDTRHYWWGLPFGIVLLVTLWEKMIQAKPLLLRALNPFVLSTVGALFIAIPSANGYLNLPRAQAPAGSPVEGMLLGSDFWGNDTAAMLNEDVQLISRYTSPNQKVLYLTKDGHYASILGRFNSVDALYVSWPSFGNLNSRIPRTEYVVADKAIEGVLAEFLSPGGPLFFVSQNSRIVIYQVRK